MIKGLMIIGVIVILVFVVGLCFYGLYRKVRRENDLDILAHEDAEFHLREERERLEETLRNARKNRNA